jgi:transcriptional regulator with XRE-family HTH domain
MPDHARAATDTRRWAHYFGALIRDLRDTYELRVGEPLTVAQLAARTDYSPSMLGAIERGESLPESGRRVQSFDDALHADDQLKTLWPVVQRLGHRTIDELASTTDLTIAGYRENGNSALPQGDACGTPRTIPTGRAGTVRSKPAVQRRRAGPPNARTSL